MLRIQGYVKKPDDYIKTDPAGVGMVEIQGRRPNQEDRMRVNVEVQEFKYLSKEKRKQVQLATFKEMQKLNEDAKCGSCAMVATAWLNEKNQIQAQAAYVGDSLAYIVVVHANGVAPSINRIHKNLHNPTHQNPKEVERVRQSNRLVYNDRVNGQLAVSRAIGDKYDLTDATDHVPEIDEFQRPLHPGDKAYLVVACDGLNINEQDIASLVVDAANTTAAADALVNAAYTKGSGDNISVMVAPITSTVVSGAVFDGHGGTVVAESLAESFYPELLKQVKTAARLSDEDINSMAQKLSVKLVINFARINVLHYTDVSHVSDALVNVLKGKGTSQKIPNDQLIDVAKKTLRKTYHSMSYTVDEDKIADIAEEACFKILIQKDPNSPKDKMNIVQCGDKSHIIGEEPEYDHASVEECERYLRDIAANKVDHIVLMGDSQTRAFLFQDYAKHANHQIFEKLKKKGISISVDRVALEREPAQDTNVNLYRMGLTIDGKTSVIELHHVPASLDSGMPKLTNDEVGHLMRLHKKAKHLAIHCGAGLGHEGVVELAYQIYLNKLVSADGNANSEAIINKLFELRAIRPGLIYTAKQLKQATLLARDMRVLANDTVYQAKESLFELKENLEAYISRVEHHVAKDGQSIDYAHGFNRLFFNGSSAKNRQANFELAKKLLAKVNVELGKDSPASAATIVEKSEIDKLRAEEECRLTMTGAFRTSELYDIILRAREPGRDVVIRKKI